MDQRNANSHPPRKPLGFHGQQLSAEQAAALERIGDAKLALSTFLDALGKVPGVDPRWLQIGRTELQKGFMFVARAIANPPTF